MRKLERYFPPYNVEFYAFNLATIFQHSIVLGEGGLGKFNNDFSLQKTLHLSGILLSFPRTLIDEHCSYIANCNSHKSSVAQ